LSYTTINLVFPLTLLSEFYIKNSSIDAALSLIAKSNVLISTSCVHVGVGNLSNWHAQFSVPLSICK